MKSSKSSGLSIGIVEAIFIIFLIIKLTNTGVIATWSWWWVISPLWIPVSIALGFMFIVFFLKFLIFLYELSKEDKKNMKVLRGKYKDFVITQDGKTTIKKSRLQEKLDSLQKPKPWR